MACTAGRVFAGGNGVALPVERARSTLSSAFGRKLKKCASEAAAGAQNTAIQVF